MSYESFKEEQDKQKYSQTLREAYYANKVGKRMAKKAIKMVNKGKSSSRAFFVDPFVDYKSANLALNAELRERGVGIKASLVEKVSGSVADSSQANFLEIDSIDDHVIEKDEDPTWETIRKN